MAKCIRIVVILILTAAIVLSCTVLGMKCTDPATYTHVIESLDDNRTKLLELSAASAVASGLISALPSDTCSPLAEQLAEFTTYFLLILSVIFLEKYLLTIFGFVSCYVLIPLGCGALLIDSFFPYRFLRSIGPKLVALGAALLLVVPTSVWANDQIYSIYNKSIEAAIQSANDVSSNLTGVLSSESGEDTSVIDEAKTVLEELPGSVASVIVKFKNVVNRYIEATAVMFVTNCLVPAVVILIFVWFIKTLFNVQIAIPNNPVRPLKHLKFKHLKNKSRELKMTESNTDT